jgi:hypothetical protein
VTNDILAISDGGAPHLMVRQHWLIRPKVTPLLFQPSAASGRRKQGTGIAQEINSQNAVVTIKLYRLTNPRPTLE